MFVSRATHYLLIIVSWQIFECPTGKLYIHMKEIIQVPSKQEDIRDAGPVFSNDLRIS